MPLPAGTVTFLFTDIEGSTLRWEAFPVEMARCVVDHDRLLRTAVADAGGTVVDRTGDGFMAVFDNADGALAAAHQAQLRLSGHDWAPVPPLRVRMGIHQGRAEVADGHYLALPVNRAARVADSGHGGQVIVSAAAAATMSTRPDLALISRGLHRLKDLSEPLELFQVVGPGLETELLPLRTLDIARSRLPVQRTAFVGRDREVERASALLDDGRLLTLCGTGGVGKTRLALHIAADLAARFNDGAHFVDLSLARQGDDVGSIVADQLGAGGHGLGAPSAEALAVQLAARQLLVVLDNCEHVADDVAPLVGALLDHAPSVSCIVTSREPMRIAGEMVLRVEPLEPGEETDPAVELFVDRARSASGAPATAFDRNTVSAICALVDRLPLAIELAAARTAHLSLDELHQRLQQHHGVLASRDRDRAERHRTIEQLLQWSTSLLDPAELAVFTRMSVFAGSVPLAAAEAVCGGGLPGADRVLDALSSLVDRSLVVGDHELGTYRMLALVRGFAADLLSAGDDAAEAHRRYWAWCAGLGEVDDDDGLRRLADRYSAEILNALAGATAAGDAPAAWAIASWAWRLLEMSGRIGDGVAALGRALALDGPPATVGLGVQTRNGLAALLLAQGDAAAAERIYREALEACSGLADRTGMGWSSIGLSIAVPRSRDASPEVLAGAMDDARRAIEIFDGSGDRRGLGHAHVAAGLVAAQQGASGEAERHFLHALACFRLDHRRRDAGAVLANLGNLALDRNDLLRAARFLDGAHQLAMEIGDRRGAGLVLNNLCLVAARRGDPRQAAAYAEQAYGHFLAIGDNQGAAIAQLHAANVMALSADPQLTVATYRDAVDRFRAARDARGVLTALANLSDYAWRAGERNAAWLAESERALIAARLDLPRTLAGSLRDLAAWADEIGDAHLAARLTAAAAGAAGLAVTSLLEEVRLLSPDSVTSRPSPTTVEATTSPAALSGLSQRELELVRLLSDGLTNAELAARLYVSRRTVDAHLSHIRAKLGISDRVKLALWAREHLG